MSIPVKAASVLFVVCTLLYLISPNALGEDIELQCITPETGIGAGGAFGDIPSAPEALAASSPERLRDGWPVDLSSPGAGFPYTPTLFDADDDGACEIFLTGGHTFGLRGDGTFLPGWPTEEHLYMGYGTNANKPGPSVADLEDDGDFEILWTERDWYAGSAHMWTFNAKEFDGSDLPNFPQVAPDESSNALDVPFVLGDTDGDGDLEAWGPHTLGNTGTDYRVTGFDHLGNLLFTTDLNPNEDIVCLYFGDADGNGTEEMFAVSFLGSDYNLYLFEADGSFQSGYPVVLHTFSSGYLAFSPPVPVDLDDDGDLEFLFGHISGWPHGFPAVVDIDGDGLQDICVATGGGEMHAIAPDGTLHAAYFQVMVSGSISGVAAGDIDHDGLFELVSATWDGWVYAWDTDGPALPGRAEWPMRGIDARNTGVFRKGFDPSAAPDATNAPTLRLHPNPVFAGGRFTLGNASADARLEIIDSSGRVLDRVDARGRTSIPWTVDGRYASGFYWARLKNGDLIQQIPVVVIR